ncbi:MULTISPECIES: (2Fe-2S)-binding protein [Arenibacter]|uniref:(2Fe-2S)-binding protein n=1 Tax=Arenibacter TaxID=178469 RepID=UPI002937248A|nr:2Fe-2S iron-sulfur cluster-binding protein [Arenibacter catalasegens]
MQANIAHFTKIVASFVLEKHFIILEAKLVSMPTYHLNINGLQKKVQTEADTPLLYVLRDYLELNGPKFGCGLSQCGSCTVLINGSAVTSCMLAISSIGTSKIITLEGLASDSGKLHAVQEAFVKEQAAQCGYCLNGMVMAAVSLLNKNPNPNEMEIKNTLQGNLCRCGSHTRIIRAIKTAANSL